MTPEYFIGKEVIIDTKAGAGEYGARLAAKDLAELRRQLAESIANGKKRAAAKDKRTSTHLEVAYAIEATGFHLNTSYSDTYRGHAEVGHELDWDIYEGKPDTIQPEAFHIFCIPCKTYWIIDQNYIGQAVSFFRFSMCEECGKTSNWPHSNFCRCKEQMDDPALRYDERESLRELHEETMERRRKWMEDDQKQEELHDYMMEQRREREREEKAALIHRMRYGRNPPKKKQLKKQTKKSRRRF